MTSPTTEIESAAPAVTAESPQPVRLVGEETVIRPRPGWQAVDFSELWRGRGLLYFLIWRDIKVRYKQTVLGVAWAVLQPLCLMLLFTVIFGRLAKMPSDGVPYPLFSFAGLLPWLFFQNCVSIGGQSLVTQAPLLTKIYFPRLFLPAASIGAGLVDFIVSLGILVVLMVWYQFVPGVTFLLLPLFVLLLLMTALGVGCILSSLTVTYRDFKLVVPFLTRVWMYVSPVVYPVSLLPKPYRWMMALNPMTGVIGGFRSVLLNQPLKWLELGISSGVAVVLFVFGLYYFRRTERRFADVV